MNKEIFAKYNSAAQSTFLSAIIDDKGVLVTSVGDSKAFISKDNKLKDGDQNVTYSHVISAIDGSDLKDMIR